MIDREITLCYRKVIDAQATRPWDKLVFEDTYKEFKMQAQYFNPRQKYGTFAELIRAVPGAGNLHFLVSAAMSGYVSQLNGRIPDIVNNLGRQFLEFSGFEFEIIDSDLHDRGAHKVAVSFFSEPVQWIDTLGDYLLLGGTCLTDQPRLTNLVKLRPYFSIYSIAENSYATIGWKDIFS